MERFVEREDKLAGVTRAERVRLISSEARSLNDPLERVERILEEVGERGTVSETSPELLAILVNNARLVVEELKKRRGEKKEK